MRLGLGNLVFVGVMLGAAALSLVRVLLVASVLPKADFGTYAAIVATGAFLGSIVSFGTVEGTVKLFPRLAARGHIEHMRSQAHGLLRRLAIRSLGMGILLFALGLLLGNQLLVIAGAASLFALAISYSSLVASMQRAIGEPWRLGGGSIFRAVLTLVAVVPIAYFGGLQWALVAEAFSILIGCYLSERFLLRPEAGAGTDDVGGAVVNGAVAAAGWDGVRVFLSYTAVSVPFYLDRLYVTATMGSDQAAEYALLALFVTAASLLVNAIAQRVGPAAIRRAIEPGGAGSAVRHVYIWCTISVAIWLVVLGSAATVLIQGWLPASLAKYDLNPVYLQPIGVLGALQISALLEFLLLAFDQERRLLNAAFCYFGVVLTVAAGAALGGVNLLGLIWLLAGARLLYCGVLVLYLRLAFGSDRGSAHA